MRQRQIIRFEAEGELAHLSASTDGTPSKWTCLVRSHACHDAHSTSSAQPQSCANINDNGNRINLMNFRFVRVCLEAMFPATLLVVCMSCGQAVFRAGTLLMNCKATNEPGSVRPVVVCQLLATNRTLGHRLSAACAPAASKCCATVEPVVRS